MKIIDNFSITDLDGTEKSYSINPCEAKSPEVWRNSVIKFELEVSMAILKVD